MYWRRAWLWDLVNGKWVKFVDAQTNTRFPSGLSGHNEPQPFIVECWWHWSTQYNPSGEWVSEECFLNYPPYVV